MKTCYRCGLAKSLDRFTINRQKTDGHSGRCKDCDRLVRQADIKKYRSWHAGAPRATHDKTCPGCDRTLPARAFARQNSNPDGLYSMCRECSRPNTMVRAARQRAREKGLPADITPAYVRSIWPEDDCCPIRRVKFASLSFRGGPQPNSPSLDRIDPSLGYVRGNVAIISQAANRVKQNETDPLLFRQIADWLERAIPAARQAVAADMLT